MAITLSTNMNLPIPGVGTEAGPDYATDVNSCLTILDGHTHTSGSGVPITPAAMNINSSLSFNNSALLDAQILGMQAQGSDPSELGCLYYKGVDLYFNDGSSNHIRMTASGSVSGATGTITGLPSGTASASYQSGSGTFVFQSATNTAADIDGRSLLLRNAAVSSHSLTLSPPAAMGADIAMTFPTIPGSTLPMTMDSGGAMGTISYNDIAANRTRPTGTTVAAGGVAISTSSGAFTTTSASAVNVTNLTVTLTTSGRPVRVYLQAGPTASGFGILTSNVFGTVSTIGASYFLRRDAVTIMRTAANISWTAGSGTHNYDLPPSSIDYTDAVAAGTYTYTLQVQSDGTITVGVQNCQLVAYEL